MRNIWTIAKRELKQYFTSPVAYIVAFLILLILGIIFALNLTALNSSPFGYQSAPDVRMVISPLAFLFLLATPALTMRLVAEEVRMGTMELMMTAPVRDHEFIIGKWLGAFLFMLALVAVTLVYPLMLNQFITPGIDQMLMLSGYLGVILLAAVFLSIGVGFSAIFGNQIVAFFGTLVFLIIMWWLVGAPANILPTGGEIFSYIDLNSHFYNEFANGIISLGGLVYYISLTLAGLIIGTTAVEVRRWK